MNMNVDIQFCQIGLRLIREEAKQKKIQIPAHMTAMRCSSIGCRPWFFVEANGMQGLEVEAQNAYQAKGIVIRNLIEKAELARSRAIIAFAANLEAA